MLHNLRTLSYEKRFPTCPTRGKFAISSENILEFINTFYLCKCELAQDFTFLFLEINFNRFTTVELYLYKYSTVKKLREDL
jgi:hypothetical protein